MKFNKHNNQGVSEMHSIACYNPIQHILNIADEHTGTLVVISKSENGQQVSIHDVVGAIVRDTTFAEEISLLRKNALNFMLDDGDYIKYLYSLGALEFLENDTLYIGKNQRGKWIWYNCVTRNIEYLTTGIKDIVNKYKAKADIKQILDTNIYKQVVSGKLKAYAVEEINGKIHKKLISINPKKDKITTVAVLEKYVAELIETLKHNEVLIRYFDSDEHSNYYITSLDEGYISKYFSERADDIQRYMYTPDKAVINLPVIHYTGECIVKAINVFMIADVTFKE